MSAVSLLMRPFSQTSSSNPSLTNCAAFSTASSREPIVVKSSSQSTTAMADSAWSNAWCLPLMRSEKDRTAIPWVWSTESDDGPDPRAPLLPLPPRVPPAAADAPGSWSVDGSLVPCASATLGCRPANRRQSISTTWREA